MCSWVLHESYANAALVCEDCLHPVGSPFATLAGGAGLGRRQGLVHAVSSAGLAGMPAGLPGVVGDIATRLPHCETTFAAKGRVGDYHGNFNPDIFPAVALGLAWCPGRRPLNPALLQGAPGGAASKLALMDNAPYHTGSTAKPSGGRRPALQPPHQHLDGAV